MFSLREFVAAAKNQNIGMDAVMVIQNDRILGLHRFTEDILHNVYSVSKTYTATGIGMAVEEGLLSLDDKPCDFFRDILPSTVDPRWEKVTLRHLITMTSGHGKAFLMADERKMLRGEVSRDIDEDMKKEWLRFAFTKPMEYEPGEQFCYGNLAPYVAGRMLEKATGMTMLDYLYKKMWEPLHIEKPRWDTDTNGHTFPASYLFLDIVDMITLGQIYLGKGEFQGKRFFSEEWANEVMSVHVSSNVICPSGCARDETAGYGYYMWKNQAAEGFRAYGREGQFVIILPEHNAVVATQAMHHNVQDVLDLVWEYILPQL